MSDIVCKKSYHYTKNNQKITDVSNSIPDITKQVKIFYDKALKINILEHRPFSCEDYLNLSKVNYRQYIRKLRPVLEKVRNSRPAFYKIKGVYLPELESHVGITKISHHKQLVCRNMQHQFEWFWDKSVPLE